MTPEEKSYSTEDKATGKNGGRNPQEAERENKAAHP